MRLHPLIVASLSLAAATFAHGNAGAQATADITFDAVTSYHTGPGGPLGDQYAFFITGVQHGASAPSTVTAIAPQTINGQIVSVTESCERDLQVMINRPGRFSLGLYRPTGLSGCGLTQLP
jgi:hypothetical protein